MILFFFMLLMLAMAWGVVDHFQSIISNTPPPKKTPVALEAPHRQPPAIAPTVSAPAPDPDSALNAKPSGAAAQPSSDPGNAARPTGEKP